jgi:hypothetical protein
VNIFWLNFRLTYALLMVRMIGLEVSIAVGSDDIGFTLALVNMDG